MSKKHWILIALIVVLAILYVHYFTDWFKPKVIQISYAVRHPPARSRNHRPIVLFGFEGQRYRLSEIEVVALAAWQTNQSVAPVWHLIANSQSRPVELFRYGQNIRGMKPAVPGTHAEPLKSNVTYRLFIRAGHITGQRDFQLGAASPTPATRQ